MYGDLHRRHWGDTNRCRYNQNPNLKIEYESEFKVDSFLSKHFLFQRFVEMVSYCTNLFFLAYIISSHRKQVRECCIDRKWVNRQ